jgi:hypothetical protein
MFEASTSRTGSSVINQPTMIFGVVDQETGDRPDGGGSKHL